MLRAQRTHAVRLLVAYSETTLSSLLPSKVGAFENVNEQLIHSVIWFKM